MSSTPACYMCTHGTKNRDNGNYYCSKDKNFSEVIKDGEPTEKFFQCGGVDYEYPEW